MAPDESELGTVREENHAMQTNDMPVANECNIQCQRKPIPHRCVCASMQLLRVGFRNPKALVRAARVEERGGGAAAVAEGSEY